SRLMPASGPTPGSTPTRVPTKQPMKPYQRTAGVRATEKPRARFWSVSSTSEPERSRGQRDLEERVEHVVRAPGHGQRDHHRRHDAQALERDEQEEEHDGHGDPVADALEPPGGEGAGGEDGEGVPPLVPADLAESRAGRAHGGESDAEEDEQDGEQDGRVGGARGGQRAEREGPALPDGDEADGDEGGAGQAVGGQHPARSVTARSPPCRSSGPRPQASGRPSPTTR